ncbi:unnamed protein product [Tetraodon nigroviridis]|uniref:(spotted green pufferfish) hypothetical protein n=1 Tax=Tetraodon nigroviridis TaxID=99883 RepID=Q4SRQ7_TETNG|nr:unnamed protein product [Tetraodon nigroviridis]
MAALILSAVELLTSPPAASGGGAGSQEEALTAVLRANRSQLLQQLEQQSALQQVRRLRQDVMAEARWLSSSTGDVPWEFVQECLVLLLALARHLSAEVERFERSAPSRPASQAPPLSPDVLSVTQQKTLASALQFVVSLGLCPYLAPGVGAPLAHRSAFGASVQKLCCGRVREPRRRLFTTATVLLEFAELPSLAAAVFTRHLNDLMAALCQLGYQRETVEGSEAEKSLELSAEERHTCREALRRLLANSYQPAVIQELLLLQNGPRQVRIQVDPWSRVVVDAWLRRLCGQLLSERLMQPSGVHAVVRAVLGPGTEESCDWRRCEAVARILVTCPQQSASADSYYATVCPQVRTPTCLALSRWCLSTSARLLADPGAAAPQRRAGSAAVPARGRQGRPPDGPAEAQPGAAAAAAAALLSAAALPSRARSVGLGRRPALGGAFSPLPVVSGGCPPQAAVEEWELSRCVDGVHKVCVLGNSRPESLLRALKGVLPVLFTLFCFTRQNVSHLRSSCQDILLWFLSHSQVEEALGALQQLCGLQAAEQQAAEQQAAEQQAAEQQAAEQQAAASLCFRPGSEGGARLCAGPESRSVPTAEDGEDGVLFEKLSGEQWRLECLAHLLAQLKDSDLPGAFLLLLLQARTTPAHAGEGSRLDCGGTACFVEDEASSDRPLLPGVPQELTDWASCEEEENQEEELTREAGVDQRGSTEQRGRRLALLQVLAALVECLHHTVLLRKRTQVVDFLATLFQRACVGLDRAPRPGLVNMVDSEALSMGMGLLAALLSEPQLGAEDYLPMLKLLPHLETLSQAHSGASVRELAFSLRGVIATRGAYQPEDLGQPHRSCSSRDQQKSASRAERSPAAPQAGSPQRQLRAVSELLLEAFDPDVPTRAVALRELAQMIQSRRREAVQAQEQILRVFLKSLEHEDSFIYLSAIQGLAVMADGDPERILHRLLQEFQPTSSAPPPGRASSLEVRLKTGEVLMRASRAMGDLAPHLGYPLVGVFLQGTKDPDPSIRASSLSNLGELCQRLDYSLGPLAQEVCAERGPAGPVPSLEVGGLLRSRWRERAAGPACSGGAGRRDEEVHLPRAEAAEEDRRPAVLSEVLLDLYRALKWVVCSDPDGVSVLQAQLALEELDGVMRRFIFPEQKLQKKIVVLP